MPYLTKIQQTQEELTKLIQEDRFDQLVKAIRRTNAGDAISTDNELIPFPLQPKKTTPSQPVNTYRLNLMMTWMVYWLNHKEFSDEQINAKLPNTIHAAATIMALFKEKLFPETREQWHFTTGEEVSVLVQMFRGIFVKGNNYAAFRQHFFPTSPAETALYYSNPASDQDGVEEEKQQGSSGTPATAPKADDHILSLKKLATEKGVLANVIKNSFMAGNILAPTDLNAIKSVLTDDKNQSLDALIFCLLADDEHRHKKWPVSEVVILLNAINSIDESESETEGETQTEAYLELLGVVLQTENAARKPGHPRPDANTYTKLAEALGYSAFKAKNNPLSAALLVLAQHIPEWRDGILRNFFAMTSIQETYQKIAQQIVSSDYEQPIPGGIAVEMRNTHTNPKAARLWHFTLWHFHRYITKQTSAASIKAQDGFTPTTRAEFLAYFTAYVGIALRNYSPIVERGNLLPDLLRMFSNPENTRFTQQAFHEINQALFPDSTWHENEPPAPDNNCGWLNLYSSNTLIKSSSTGQSNISKAVITEVVNHIENTLQQAWLSDIFGLHPWNAESLCKNVIKKLYQELSKGGRYCQLTDIIAAQLNMTTQQARDHLLQNMGNALAARTKNLKRKIHPCRKAAAFILNILLAGIPGSRNSLRWRAYFTACLVGGAAYYSFGVSGCADNFLPWGTLALSCGAGWQLLMGETHSIHLNSSVYQGLIKKSSARVGLCSYLFPDCRTKLEMMGLLLLTAAFVIIPNLAPFSNYNVCGTPLYRTSITGLISFTIIALPFYVIGRVIWAKCTINKREQFIKALDSTIYQQRKNSSDNNGANPNNLTEHLLPQP